MPDAEEINGYYEQGYHDYWQNDSVFNSVCSMKETTAAFYLWEVAQYTSRGALLDIGCSFGQLLLVARRLGFDTLGLELSSEAIAFARKAGLTVIDKPIHLAGLRERSFNAITMIDVIEHVSAPIPFMEEVARCIETGGSLLLVTPDIGSVPARILGNLWSHHQREHLCYYSPSSMQCLLEKSGFSVKTMKAGRKALTVGYILNHLRVFTGGAVGRLAHGVERMLPQAVLSHVLWFRTGLMTIAERE